MSLKLINLNYDRTTPCQLTILYDLQQTMECINDPNIKTIP